MHQVRLRCPACSLASLGSEALPAVDCKGANDAPHKHLSAGWRQQCPGLAVQEPCMQFHKAFLTLLALV